MFLSILNFFSKDHLIEFKVFGHLVIMAKIRPIKVNKKIFFIFKIIKMFDDQLEQANSILTQSILKKSNAVSASAMLVTQFMPNSSVLTTNDSMERVRLANKVKLEAKLVKLREKQHEIVESIDYLNLNLSELQEKLDGQRPELIELRKKRENYHMWLLQRGENEEKIQTVIEPGENLIFKQLKSG